MFSHFVLDFLMWYTDSLSSYRLDFFYYGIYFFRIDTGFIFV